MGLVLYIKKFTKRGFNMATNISSDNSKFNPVKHDGNPISCDQVSWLLAIFDRYLSQDTHPSICRKREMMKYGMLYEVMEIARLSFEDESAVFNGTPGDVKPYIDENKQNLPKG